MQEIPLVLLPGVLNTSALWQEQIRVLATRHEIICPLIHDDDDLGRIAARTLREIPAPTFALAGFSMGGYVALEILAQAAERVACLALVNSKAEPDTEAEQHHRMISIKAASQADEKQTRFAGITPRLIRKLLHPDNVDNRQITDCLYAMAEEIGRDGFLHQQTANLHRQDRRDALADFRRPVLLISGAADQTVPAEKTFAAKTLVPHAITLLIEKAAHLSPLEAPEQMTQALQAWLDSA